MENLPKINPRENEFAAFYIVKSFDYPEYGDDIPELEKIIKTCYSYIKNTEVEKATYGQKLATSQSIYGICENNYNKLYESTDENKHYNINKASAIDSIVTKVIDAIEGNVEIIDDSNTVKIHGNNIVEDDIDSKLILLANIELKYYQHQNIYTPLQFEGLYKDYSTKFTNFVSRIKALYPKLKTTELKGNEKQSFWNDFLEKNNYYLSDSAKDIIEQKIPRKNQNQVQGYLFPIQHK